MRDNDIFQVSIKEFLESVGIPTRKEGARYFASSPFSRDSNWSFVIYPTNTYFDFSTGHGGNILNLIARMDNVSLSEAAAQLKNGIAHEKYKPNYKKIKEDLFKEVEFNLERYINKNEKEIAQIRAYAESRGITDGYFPGVFFTREHGRGTYDNQWVKAAQHPLKWIRVPSLGFLHVDKNLKPCGAKFRRIDNNPNRYSARGMLGLFVIPTQDSQINKSNVLYVVEGEINALSLQSYLEELQLQANVISLGGIAASITREDDLVGLVTKDTTIKLIIDYDGNEELYQQRLKLYQDLDAQPIKLILPKGEDINSLYVKNEMWKIEQLLL